MSAVKRRGRSVRATSPNLLTAWRALPTERRGRVRALVVRRGYPLDKAMAIPERYLIDHLLDGYEYRPRWGPFKTFITVALSFLVTFAVFSFFWRS